MTAATLKGAYIRLYYYKARSALSSLNEKISAYTKVTWQKRRDQIAKVINKLPLVSRLAGKKPVKEPQSPVASIESKEEIKERQLQSKQWSKQAEELNETLEKLAWCDFASNAKLKLHSEKETFDTLDTLNQLLSNCDFDLLSDETKEMLEKQLGIDIPALEYERKKDGTAVKTMVRNFFNMYDDAFVQFVGQQNFLRPQQTS